MRKLFYILVCTIFIFLFLPLSLYAFINYKNNKPSKIANTQNNENIEASAPTIVPTFFINLPQSKTLETNYHIFQTFNNCGPASLSMAYHFYGINISQQDLGNKLRPYQVANGDNDDKSTTLVEMAKDAESRGFIAIYRPNGNIDLIKQFIYYDIPVITRTWKTATDDVGHYRVVKGYDENKKILIQDDSLQGKNLEYSYDNFNDIWQKFNFEYLILVPKDKESAVRNILGKNYDTNTAWKNAVTTLKTYVSQNPTDYQAKFNLSVAYYNIGEYQKSVNMYEESKDKISKRSLWYQIEPIKSYYELKQYDKALGIIDTVLNTGNRAYSEAYILKGDIFKALNNPTNAKQNYEKAVFYNTNLQEAKDRLNSL